MKMMDGDSGLATADGILDICRLLLEFLLFERLCVLSMIKAPPWIADLFLYRQLPG